MGEFEGKKRKGKSYNYIKISKKHFLKMIKKKTINYEFLLSKGKVVIVK